MQRECIDADHEIHQRYGGRKIAGVVQVFAQRTNARIRRYFVELQIVKVCLAVEERRDIGEPHRAVLVAAMLRIAVPAEPHLQRSAAAD